eukprot:403344952
MDFEDHSQNPDTKLNLKFNPEWTKIKDIVLDSEPELLDSMVRQMRMQKRNNKDFLMKMRLYKRHPSILKGFSKKQGQEMRQKVLAEMRGGAHSCERKVELFSNYSNSAQKVHSNQSVFNWQPQVNIEIKNNQDSPSMFTEDKSGAADSQKNHQNFQNIGRIKRKERFKDIGTSRSIYVVDKGQDVFMDRVQSIEQQTSKVHQTSKSTFRKRNLLQSRDQKDITIRKDESEVLQSGEVLESGYKHILNQNDSKSRLREILHKTKLENQNLLGKFNMDKDQTIKQIKERERQLEIKKENIRVMNLERMKREDQGIQRKFQGTSQNQINKVQYLAQSSRNTSIHLGLNISKTTLNFQLPKIIHDQDYQEETDLDQDIPIKPHFSDSQLNVEDDIDILLHQAKKEVETLISLNDRSKLTSRHKNCLKPLKNSQFSSDMPLIPITARNHSRKSQSPESNSNSQKALSQSQLYKQKVRMIKTYHNQVQVGKNQQTRINKKPIQNTLDLDDLISKVDMDQSTQKTQRNSSFKLPDFVIIDRNSQGFGMKSSQTSRNQHIMKSSSVLMSRGQNKANQFQKTGDNFINRSNFTPLITSKQNYQDS